ncbi:hypothetical protein AVEN_181111-1 [Araneus ventricosus]|uniref:Uncharacterized protein n=1 Tax=Araneus ventricosus TaxID=182803 RepID=A0A4Y2LS30_ARAVE|nr:hypothetical protein AVEN_181111-1 [Araneus ventricosus]
MCVACIGTKQQGESVFHSFVAGQCILLFCYLDTIRYVSPEENRFVTIKNRLRQVTFKMYKLLEVGDDVLCYLCVGACCFTVSYNAEDAGSSLKFLETATASLKYFFSLC